MEDLFKALPTKFRPTILIDEYLDVLGENTGPFTGKPVINIVNHFTDLYINNDDKFIGLFDGKTGSGKSLCMAAFLYVFFNKEYHVVLAEPKIKLATKLAKDIGTWYSQIIKYKDNIGSKTSEDTISRRNRMEAGIDVVTTGIMYKMMLNGQEDNSNDTRIFIIDEVHEKTFVNECIELATNIIANGGKMFLLLMSATIDVESIIKMIRFIIIDNKKEAVF